MGAAAVLFVVLTKPIATGPSAEPMGNITVTSPKAGEKVSSPITVTGTERTFEQNVVWELRILGGDVLASGNTTGHAPDLGIFGDYSFTIDVPPGAPKNLEIAVFDRSAKDGEVIDLVVVPVVLK